MKIFIIAGPNGAGIAFETTLSVKNYLNKIRIWKELDYDVQLIFLSLPDAIFAINRVKQRVKQGGHNIPEAVIRRRYARGLNNLAEYKKLVNAWQVYDNSASATVLVEEGKNEGKEG